MTSATAPRALYAQLTARPGMGDQVAALLADFARKVRQEPGNVAFDCYRLEADSAKFFVSNASRVDGPPKSTLFDTWCIADVDVALALQRLNLNGDEVPSALKAYAEANWQRPSVEKWNALKRG